MQNNRTLNRLKILLFSLFLLPIMFSCNRLDNIPYSPSKTPAECLKEQPYVNLRIAESNFILIQPTSTIFVYSLGILTLLIGIYFIKNNKKQKSKKWWGIALIFWGLGALLAGTSYQAFGYEIKCNGREYCVWTSWWEIFYLIFTAASVDAMMMAQTHSSLNGKWQKTFRIYAVTKCLLLTTIILIGALLPSKFLVSFELLILVSLPSMIIFMFINAYHYKKYKDSLNIRLFLAWIFLGVVIVVYFLYLISGYGEQLYEKGIWFTANDVLHLGLVLWMLYILFALSGIMKDVQPSDKIQD